VALVHTTPQLEMLRRLLFSFTLILRLLAAQDRIVLETSTIVDGKGVAVKGQRIRSKAHASSRSAKVPGRQLTLCVA
jgi:hypothetical protein